MAKASKYFTGTTAETLGVLFECHANYVAAPAGPEEKRPKRERDLMLQSLDKGDLARLKQLAFSLASIADKILSAPAR